MFSEEQSFTNLQGSGDILSAAINPSFSANGLQDPFLSTNQSSWGSSVTPGIGDLSNTQMTAFSINSQPHYAHTISVNNLGDFYDGNFNNGVTTLREAIAMANYLPGDDLIDITGVQGTISLSSALPLIDSNMAFEGSGVNTLTISGNNSFRPFFVKSGTVSFSNFTIANGTAIGGNGGNGSTGGGGAAGIGGGLFIYEGNVNVESVAFSNNRAIGGNGGRGGSTASDEDGGGGGGGGFGGNGGNGDMNKNDYIFFELIDTSGGGGGGGFSGSGSNGGANDNTYGGTGGIGGFGGFYGPAAGGGLRGAGNNGYLGGGGGGGGGYSYIDGSTTALQNGGAGGNGSFGAGGGGGGDGTSGENWFDSGFGGAGGDGGYGGGGGGAGRGWSLYGSVGGSGGDGGYGGGGGGGGAGTGTQFGTTVGFANGGDGEGGRGGMFAGRGGHGYGFNHPGIPEGGAGGGGAGLGGAVFIRAGSLNLIDTTFQNNSTQGGVGGMNEVPRTETNGSAGQGKGAAIFAATDATVATTNVTFNGNIASNPGNSTTDNNNLYGTIDNVSRIAIATDQTNLVESGSPSNLTISRNDTKGDLTVNVAIGGSATPGTDFTLSGANINGNLATLIIPDGASSVQIQVIPVNDTVFDPYETIDFTLAAGNGYIFGTNNSVDLTIKDDEPIVVDTLVDENDGNLSVGDVSLREAIDVARDGDTINVAPLLQGSINLNSSLLIDEDLKIDGPGANLLSVSGNNASRVFEIASGAVVEIEGLAIANGLTDTNGGGIVNQGTLTVNNSILRNNSASYGGAIHNTGTLTVNNSTLKDNSATFGGGAIYGDLGSVSIANSTIDRNSSLQGGGISNFSNLTVTNSTLSNNSAVNGTDLAKGGGIYQGFGTATLTNSTVSGNQSAFYGAGIHHADGDLTVTHSTITNNTASVAGSGIYHYLAGGTAAIGSTIVAGNHTLYNPIGDVYGSFTSLDYNLIGDTAGGIGFAQLHDRTGYYGNVLDPKLGPLQDNGGSTWTHALLFDSPAIDGADLNAFSSDQRGVSSEDGKRDIGAFEWRSPSLTINDVSRLEGHNGIANLDFTVSLNAPSWKPVYVTYMTAPQTALPGSDFAFMNGNLTFNPGETTKTISIPVVGNTLPEADETFLVNLFSPGNATLADSQGVGTILNDDYMTLNPTLSINDVSRLEGNNGIVNFDFTVSLDAPSWNPVYVTYNTAWDKAFPGSDYAATNGNLTFNPGETSKTISVKVVGDRLREADETFFVNLLSPVNATLADSQGVGTILNDDIFMFSQLPNLLIAEAPDSGTVLNDDLMAIAPDNAKLLIDDVPDSDTILKEDYIAISPQQETLLIADAPDIGKVFNDDFMAIAFDNATLVGFQDITGTVLKI